MDYVNKSDRFNTDLPDLWAQFFVNQMNRSRFTTDISPTYYRFINDLPLNRPIYYRFITNLLPIYHRFATDLLPVYYRILVIIAQNLEN